MPKQVDRDERRREIATAVLRLVTTRGVEAASLRTVASEAGVSMGAVQHYFTTKDEMLRFALAYGNTLLAERAARLMAEQKPDTPRGTFRLFCTLLIPLDEDSRAGARLWAGLISRGCVDEPTRKLAALAYANLTDFVMRQLNDALPGADAGQAARHLVSVIEGLRWPVLFGVYSEQQAMDVLDAQLDLIFGSVHLRQSGTVHWEAERGITLVTDNETPGAAMDGRAHYRKAEQFAEKAAEYLGHGDGQDTASVWAAVAQVHATLAVAAGLEPEPEPAAPGLDQNRDANPL